jgi:alpha-galactosidase
MPVIDWITPAFALRFLAGDDQPVRLVDISTSKLSAEPTYPRAHQPLVEVFGPQYGNTNNSNSGRYSGTKLGTMLRYVTHHVTSEATLDQLTIEQHDPVTGLTCVSTFTAPVGVPAARAATTVSIAPGRPPLTLWAVTSLATGAAISSDINALDIWSARCTWSAENRWSSQPLRAAGLASIQPRARGETCRSALSFASQSTWSSGEHVPAGAVQDRNTSVTLAFQIEHNGPWLWEAGERPKWTEALDAPDVGSAEAAGPPVHNNDDDGAYIALLGPTDGLHQWSYVVDSDRPFTTVPVSFTVADSFDQAFTQLAGYRRAIRRDHPQNETLPVIFNDYMDTLEGDPTEAKLLPLIAAAAAVGCEYFCIDAGWYDDTSGWWASVGDWQPSTVRFPNGLGYVLDAIRDHGMVPGLWLEPEVVGVDSSAASMLPDDAFLQRAGVRIRERDRYFLDLRSHTARAHLDAAVDRLVGEMGVGFFKLDYNVTPGAGTDYDTPSVGHGLLEHNRALLTWLESVLDRHPTLVLENCGSGALRSDFAMLSRLQLQSTSDQQDPLLYPAIAVGALVHILPEQAGNWSYPQATMSDEMIAFNMCTGLAGRLYQAGLLDRMTPDQLALVAAGISAHKDLRNFLTHAAVSFPTGLPSWDDTWITVAFNGDDETYLLAWRQKHAPSEVSLNLPVLAGRNVEVTQVYPPVKTLPEWNWSHTATGITLNASEKDAAARLLRAVVAR